MDKINLQNLDSLNWSSSLFQILNGQVYDVMESGRVFKDLRRQLSQMSAEISSQLFVLSDPQKTRGLGQSGQIKQRSRLQSLKHQDSFYQRTRKKIQELQNRFLKDVQMDDTSIKKNLLNDQNIADKLWLNKNSVSLSPEVFWQSVRQLKADQGSAEKSVDNQVSAQAERANSLFHSVQSQFAKALSALKRAKIGKIIMPFVQAALTVASGPWMKLGGQILGSTSHLMGNFLTKLWEQVLPLAGMFLNTALVEQPQLTANQAQIEAQNGEQKISENRGAIASQKTSQQVEMLQKAKENAQMGLV